jgi:hypothetical protein
VPVHGPTGSWAPSSVRAMLYNERYAGIVAHGELGNVTRKGAKVRLRREAKDKDILRMNGRAFASSTTGCGAKFKRGSRRRRRHTFATRRAGRRLRLPPSVGADDLLGEGYIGVASPRGFVLCPRAPY